MIVGGVNLLKTTGDAKRRKFEDPKWEQVQSRDKNVRCDWRTLR